MAEYHALSGSVAEDMFIDLFCETFGAEQAGYLYSQYPFYDIYENSRFADFMLEAGGQRVAFEIDDESSHKASNILIEKFQDDLLRQNSMIYKGWQVYRWAVRQLQSKPETVREELRVFLGQHPMFREIQDYLPTQRGQAFELRGHQKEALKSLTDMRAKKETIALLYHATGTGKTTTAVLDAKCLGGRTLFLAHSHELVTQACGTFRSLWKKAACGVYMDKLKQPNAHIVCGSIEKSDKIVVQTVEKINDGEVELSRLTKTVLVIDEAQDMSAAEYSLVKVLMDKNNDLRVIAVGDDDQNIYEFRGSRSAHFESLTNEPDAKKYELIDNYRSNANIVDFANQFAKTISHRFKTQPIMPKRSENGEITICKLASEHIVIPVVNAILNVKPSGSTCVITRTNEESLNIVGLLSQKGITAR